MTIEPSSPEPQKRSRSGWWIDLLLVVVLLGGAYLRTAGLFWGEYQYLHPDERFLVWVGSDITPMKCSVPVTPVDACPANQQTWMSFSEYFDAAKSTLNPENRGHAFYVYGTLPMFAARFLVQWIFGHSGFDVMTQVGRSLSALVDLLAVFLVFLVGSRLYGRWVGLLGAAFSAVAVLQIQQAHFFTMDTFSVFFTLLAFYFAVRVMTEARAWQGLDYRLQDFAWRKMLRDPLLLPCLGFGVALGCAVASKLNVAPIAAALPVGMLVGLSQAPAAARRERFFQAAIYLALAAFASLLVFRLAQPYAFSGPGFFGLKPNPQWVASLREQRAQASPDADFPPAMQWARRSNLFSFQNLVEWGLGLPLGVLAWAGFLWAGWRMLKGEWRKHILIWSWTGLYFGWQSLALNPTMRYQLPVYPMLAIFAAWAIVRMVEGSRLKVEGSQPAEESSSAFNLQPSNPGPIRWLGVLVGAAVLIATAAYAYGFTRIYERPVTRVEATRWIYQNIPGPVNLKMSGEEGVASQPLPFPYNYTITPGIPYETSFVARTTGVLTEVTLGKVLDRQAEPGERTLALTVSSAPGGDLPLASARLTAAFPASGGAPDVGYTLQLDQPVALVENTTYYLKFDLLGAAAEPLQGQVTVLVQSSQDGSLVDVPLAEAMLVSNPNLPYTAVFAPPVDGEIVGIGLSVPGGAPANAWPASLNLTLDIPGEPLESLDSALTADPAAPTQRLLLASPIAVGMGGSYRLSLYMRPQGGALTFSGAGIATEGDWDDGLPLRMDGYDGYGGIYPLDLTFNMYWDDNPDKLARFTRVLDEADYIVMSSNRQWGSLPRIPERFPMTTLYYRSLLGCPAEADLVDCYRDAVPGMYAGELGYELVQVFQSDPGIGPFRLNDQYAEEAFTVYDHPKVMVFKKTADYSPERVQALLGSVDFSQVIRIAPMRAGPTPVNLMLPSDREAEQQAGGTWSELFNTQSWINRFPFLTVAAWYLAVFAAGLLAFPLVRLALPGLSDRGYPLARISGLLIVAYLSWLGGSLRLPFTRPTISLVLALVAGLSLLAAYAQRDDLRREWAAGRRYLLIVEGLFLALFLLDLFIRLGNPDLWHPYKGGEKPMDFAYFNAVLKSTSFPPYDPWYAGGYLNYYYYGFVVAGVLVKWLGIVPSVAYNLILPTMFALIGIGAFSLAYNLVQATGLAGRGRLRWKYWAGLGGALGMVVLGNQGIPKMFYEGWQRLAAPNGVTEGAGLLTRWTWAFRGFFLDLSGAPLPYRMDEFYWNPSRIIPAQGDVEPITEFPFFTVLYGDPHAHLFALPVALLALGFALSVVLSRGRWKSLGGTAAGFALGAIAVGALRPTNTWDLPTYLAICGVALGYALWRYACSNPRGLRRLPFWTDLPERLRRPIVALAGVALLAGLAVALYQPYAEWYSLGYSQFALWKGSHTYLSAYLAHWGLFLFVVLSWMAWETRDWLASTPAASLRKLAPYKALLQAGALLLLAGILALLWLQVHIAWFVLPLAAWAGVLIFRPDLPDAKRFVLFLVGTALALTLLVEVIVLKGDIARMNMVFKFYLQAWTLLAVCAAAALGWLLPALPAWLPGWRRTFQAGLVFLVAGAALYPLMGGLAKVKDRMVATAPHTLDGMAYMNYAAYDWQGVMDLSQDYRAIRWMQENVQGSPVIVEANLRELYRWGSRFSIYTGLPGVVGWEWHQQQQRAVIPSSWVSSRIAEIDAFYTTTSVETAARFLQKYGVRYIIVGQLERNHYPGPGLEKFTQANGAAWQEVYRDGETVIYRVNDPAL